MMLAHDQFRVIHVSTHVSLREACDRVKKDRVYRVIRLGYDAVKRLGVENPKIAVAGLNPHAGEEGLLGEEEAREIVPAINRARSQGIMVEGPFPADSFFNLSAPHPFDAVISMYHDQGLIPMKMSDFREAVNFTLGLPFIRTSVGHGTAYDIAGKGLADPSNLIQAILTASHLSQVQVAKSG